MPPLSARQLAIEIAIILAVILVVAVLGPFGTFALGGLEARILYWALMIGGGYAIIRPLMLLAPRLAARLALPELAVWAGLLMVAAVPVTFLVWYGGGSNRAPAAAEFLRLYPNVMLLGALVAAIFWLLRKGQPPLAAQPPATPPQPVAAPRVEAPAAPPSARSAPRLAERLPPGRLGPIRALEMEDHYVRVHHPHGSDLLLMRMRDAIAELDGVDGLQVHRSWWVARAAVERIEQDGRTVRLHLAGGLVAPVARDVVARLRAAGWLRPL